ncbi:unnamed protein product, partial [Prorocentrum cordatum]
WLKAGRLHLLLVRHSGVLTTGLCSEVARARAPTEMINGQLLVGTRGPPLPESACAGCRRPTPGPAACPEPAEGGALASGRAAPSGAPLGSSGVHQRLVASLSGKLQHVLEQHEHAPVHDGAAHADRSQQGLAGRTSRASLRQSLSAAGLPFPGRLLLLPPGARAARRRPQQGAGRCRRPGGGGPIVARGPCRWPWSPRRLGRPLRTRSRLCPQLLVLACPGAALAGGASATAIAGGVEAAPAAASISPFPSVGSIGHPRSCGRPCKYAGKPKSCKVGYLCDRCHLCHWTRSKDARARVHVGGLAQETGHQA